MAHFYLVKTYELIEHTADIGIRVKGADLKALFANAAAAMFDIISEKKEPGNKKQTKITIEQQAETSEELLVNWLNELLSLSAAKELIFSDFKINKIDNNNLQAEATGEGINNYKVNTEIKAATYHELRIQKSEAGWQAEIIFDV